MTSKAIKGYKFIVGGKSRPGIVGVKPKSGGVVDEFKSRKLKQLGKTQRKLKSQDKEMGKAMGEAKKRGASRKDLVKGRKFQRDNRRAQREGDKLRKDVLRVGKAMGGGITRAIDKLRGKPATEQRKGDTGTQKKKAPFNKPDRPMTPTKPMKPRDKRKPIDPKTKKDSLREKIKPKKKMDRLEELRKELGMKKGGKAKKKFPDLTGDGKVTQADILKGRGVFRKGGASK